MNNKKRIIIRIMQIFSALVLVFGLIFVVFTVLRGINSSFDSTHTETAAVATAEAEQ